MKPNTSRIVRLSAAIGLFVVLLTAVPFSIQDAPASGATTPAVLQAGKCFRFTFTIAGAPNWKVLEVIPAGWIRAEIDAGPPGTMRETVWVNTAQIVTIREAPCSN
jgi:hypothetical protein